MKDFHAEAKCSRREAPGGCEDFNAEPQRGRGWEVRKMKFTFAERKQKGFPELPLLAATQNHGVILKSKYENRTVEATKALDTLKLVEIGDFVISLRSFQGGLEMAYDRGIISPAYTILVPTHITREYFKYYAKSPEFISILKSTVTGIREGQNIDYNRLREYYIEIPPVDVQIKMGRYLDAETGKIDRAIAAEEKMIALLQERREIVINEAVGGGEDFNAEPQSRRGWEVRRLKSIATCNDEVLPESTLDSAMIEYIEISDVNESNGIFNSTFHLFKNAPSRARRITRKGDVIVSTVRTYLKAIANVDREGLIVSTGFAVLRARPYIVPRFLAYAVKSSVFKDDVVRHSTGTSYPAINACDLMRLPIPLPPLAEQERIVEYLDAETGKIDRAIEVKRRQIGLLRERREIVINEAVTGKMSLAERGSAKPAAKPAAKPVLQGALRAPGPRSGEPPAAAFPAAKGGR